MRSHSQIVLAACLACALAPAARANQWAGPGGGGTRSGLVPPQAFAALVGVGEDEPSPPAAGVRGAGAGAAARAPLSSLGAVYTPSVVSYTVGSSTYELRKNAAPVVSVSGSVLYVTDTCEFVGLPTPDATFETWARPYFTFNNEVNAAIGSQCDDLLLTAQDHALHVSGESAVIDGDTVVGYSIGFAGSQLTELPNFPVATGTALPSRLLGVFAVGSVYTVDADGETSGWMWVPSSPLFSGVGVVLVNVDTGVKSDIKMGTSGGDHGAGSVVVPNPAGGDDMAVFATAPALGVGSTNVLSAFSPTGGTPTLRWTSAATGSASPLQPHPNYVPGTGAAPGRIYMALFEGTPVTSVKLVCALATDGSNCPGGFPAALPTAFDSWPVSWWFAGALVPNAAGSRVVRLLFTVDIRDTAAVEPIGCLVAVSPTTGGVLEHLCVPRDPAGRDADTNFLATAPVVFVNARGAGLHTAFVAQYDSVLLAFDPANLGAGVLYALDPIAKGDKVTVSTDYLAVTGKNSILLVGWREGTADSEFVITAVRAVTTDPRGGGGGAAAPAPAGLSPAAGGAVAGVVIALAAALVLVPTYRSGSLGAALEDAGLASVASALPAAVYGFSLSGSRAGSYRPAFKAVPGASSSVASSGFSSSGSYGAMGSL